MRPGLRDKSINIQRYISWHSSLLPFNNIRVSEFPKSGGTWLCQMIGFLYQLPFPRHTWLPLSKCIEQAHYLGPTGKRTIVLVRDGRDVFTSAYFHFLFDNKNKPPGLVEYWRNISEIHNPDNVIDYMPQFIKAFTEQFKIGGRHVSWSNHIMSYDYKKEYIHLCKYENLINSAEEELEKIVEWSNLGVQTKIEDAVARFSFEKLSGRPAGAENRASFLRKGVTGDWKNYFSNKAIDVFEKYHGRAMKDLGYD